MCLVYISVGITILCSETVLFVVDYVNHDIRVTNQPAIDDNKAFDSRTPLQVINDFRMAGLEVYPLTTRAEFGERKIYIQNKEVFPLAGISRTDTVHCNELGTYYIYPSDEHGFNNPLGLWNQTPIQIASIGDSFTYGECVPPEQNTTSLMRSIYPKSINLGMSSSGTLDQLAIMKEYLIDLKPQIVLWFYWEGNDLFDILQERQLHPSLNEYLVKDYNQGLVTVQKEIDIGLKEIANSRINDTRAGFWTIRTAREIIFLRNWRNRLTNLTRIKSCEIDEDTLEFFQVILREGKDYIDSWAGELYLVYLPTWSRYGDTNTAGIQCANLIEFHGQVINIATQENIPVIDLSEVFDRHPDPLSLFPFRLFGHYNGAGYRLVADEVLEFLHQHYPQSSAVESN